MFTCRFEMLKKENMNNTKLIDVLHDQKYLLGQKMQNINLRINRCNDNTVISFDIHTLNLS